MEKLLSIIVPSYNMEKYLPKCLGSLIVDDSVLLQKLDVIVVNDGSKDRTSEIAHDYERRYPDVFNVIDKRNGHYGSCINAALPVARGEYVKILDADDSFDTQALEVYLRTIKSGLDVIFTDFAVIDKNGLITETVRCRLAESVTLTRKDFAAFSECVQMHAVTYRTQMLREIKYRQSEGIAYTDQEWVYLPLAHCQRAGCIHQLLYRYFVGREGQSVQSAQYARNSWMMQRIVARAMHEFMDVSCTLNDDAQLFLRKRLLGLVRNMYALIFFKLPYKQIHMALLDFEKCIPDELGFLRRETDEIAIPRKRGFHYVRHARKNCCRIGRIYVLTIRALSALALSVSRMKRFAK